MIACITYEAKEGRLTGWHLFTYDGKDVEEVMPPHRDCWGSYRSAYEGLMEWQPKALLYDPQAWYLLIATELKLGTMSY